MLKFDVAILPLVGPNGKIVR